MSAMLKILGDSGLHAFRRPTNWQLVSNVCICQSLGSKKSKLEFEDNSPVKKLRPKTVRQSTITLLSPEKDISVVTMDVASKLCERRGLKLVKIIDIDTKTQRPVYQMMTPNQFLKEEKKRIPNTDEKNINKLKGEKKVLINCHIGRSDLEFKVNHILKWLDKMHEVRVTVTGDTANEIADEIIKMTQECSRVVQKREKGDTIKFQLLPPKET